MCFSDPANIVAACGMSAIDERKRCSETLAVSTPSMLIAPSVSSARRSSATVSELMTVRCRLVRRQTRALHKIHAMCSKQNDHSYLLPAPVLPHTPTLEPASMTNDRPSSAGSSPAR